VRRDSQRRGLAALVVAVACLSAAPAASATTLDQTFGTGGIARIPSTGGAGPPQTARGIAVQNDGKIVLAGDAEAATSEQWAVARLTSDGVLDNNGPGAFSIDGKLAFPMSATSSGVEAKDVKVQQDGKIVVAGEAR
jgi:beta-propeller uncharacterized protein DUF5122